jgi:hypothetical protein
MTLSRSELLEEARRRARRVHIEPTNGDHRVTVEHVTLDEAEDVGAAAGLGGGTSGRVPWGLSAATGIRCEGDQEGNAWGRDVRNRLGLGTDIKR